MALLPKEQAAVADARKRGLSQKKIDFFLNENPGDYSRLASQKPDDPNEGARARAAAAAKQATPTPKPVAPTLPSAPPPVSPPLAALGAPPPPTDAPMAGLTAIAPEAAATPTPSPITMGGGGGAMLEPEPPSPTGVATTALGQLRALGRRTPPSGAAVFSGRIY